MVVNFYDPTQPSFEEYEKLMQTSMKVMTEGRKDGVTTS